MSTLFYQFCQKSTHPGGPDAVFARFHIKALPFGQCLAVIIKFFLIQRLVLSRLTTDAASIPSANFSAAKSRSFFSIRLLLR